MCVTHLPPGKILLHPNLGHCKVSTSIYHLVFTSHQTFSCYNSPHFWTMPFNLFVKLVTIRIQQGCQLVQQHYPLDNAILWTSHIPALRKSWIFKNPSSLHEKPPFPFASSFLWQMKEPLGLEISRTTPL